MGIKSGRWHFLHPRPSEWARRRYHLGPNKEVFGAELCALCGAAGQSLQNPTRVR